MPDRDYLPKRIPRHWCQTARLYRSDGFGPEVLACAQRALAASLRDRLNTNVLDVAHLGTEVEEVVRASLLGPMRAFRLREHSADQVEAEECALLTSLAPAARWHRDQVARGRVPTARPVRHRRTEDILRETVYFTGSPG